jgi:NAD(P)-dependent dehydrogenase (short-subunit alcohol dehydrogenase family)
VGNPVALVTGASRGIGRQLCVDLAGAGYDVVCAARSSAERPGKLPGTVEDTAYRVEVQGRRALPVSLDVRDEDAVAALVARAHATFGRLDLLVNNAAVAPPLPALRDTTRRWRVGVDVNLNAPFYFIYHAVPLMRNAGGGRIVNISSMAAVTPEFGRPNYTATKRALEAMTEALAFELRKDPIAVNCIRLEVPVWTEGFAETLPRDAAFEFEDPVIMSDAVLWLAGQPFDYSGHVLTIGDLRERGAVRPFTPAQRG